MSAHTGRPATAPCGHPGHHVVGNYVACDLKCDADRDNDGVPVEVDAESTPRISFAERCPYCGSHEIEPFVAHYFGTVNGKHCLPCGKVWS